MIDRSQTAANEPAPGERVRRRPVDGYQSVLAALPRNERLSVKSGEFLRTQMPTGGVRVSRFVVLGRITRIGFLVLRFCAATGFDWITRKDSTKRRAVRLRAALEFQGGAAIKIGQQLSIRRDILSPAYCDELSALLDHTTQVIELDDVIRAVKEQIGKELSDVFQHFDPEPIGSASIACVYQAILKDGTKVAVKVRRPGIQKLFMADLDVLDWTLRLTEFLTLMRPGVSRNVRREMRQILVEELDFRVEARYQELLRRYYRNRKKLAIAAPKVHHALSGEKVLVSDFVPGFLLTDIIFAVERGDQQVLSELSALGIHPPSIAKRLIRASFYSMLECPLYHGDPHPSNIIVQPNGRIVMIDFGACGVLSQRERDLVREIHYYQSRDDVGGMVQAIISLMEPLPHVDIDSFSKDLEEVCWQYLYGIKSKHAQWWERSTMSFWLGMLRVVREYKFPLPPNLLRMIRATLLYDTVAASVYPQIDLFREFRKYAKSADKRVRKRFHKRLGHLLVFGPDVSHYSRMERVWETSNVLLFRIRQYLSRPRLRFTAMADKVYGFIGISVRWVNANLFLALAALVFAVVVHPSHLDLFSTVFDRDWSLFPDEAPDRLLQTIFIGWLGSAAVVTLLYGRRILWRFGEREIESERSV